LGGFTPLPRVEISQHIVNYNQPLITSRTSSSNPSITRQSIMEAKNPTVAVSAPGKVLLAGGYLVLDRKHTGLVFGLSARINVIASEIHTSQGVQLHEVVVDSPQFLDAQWRYGYHLAPEGGGIKVTQLQV
jgi:phosphomevalonate kinase